MPYSTQRIIMGDIISFHYEFYKASPFFVKKVRLHYLLPRIMKELTASLPARRVDRILLRQRVDTFHVQVKLALNCSVY